MDKNNKQVQMKHSKIYGFALIAGTLGAAITMLFHPSGRDLLGQPDDVARRNELITVVAHSMGLVSLPVIFFGFTGLSRRLNLESPLVSAAIIVYGFGTVGAMCAAVINGLVGPVLTRKIIGVDEESQKLLQMLLMNNSLLNQAFTKVYVVGVSAAFILWSIRLLKMGNFARIVAITGLTIGVLSAFAIFSGHLRLDVHGFGAIVFAQSIWTILMGIFMIRARSKTIGIHSLCEIAEGLLPE